MTRIAFIGGGNMARSLIGGLLKTGVSASSITRGRTAGRIARQRWAANSA